ALFCGLSSTVSLSLFPPPPTSTLFPYTTLFPICIISEMKLSSPTTINGSRQMKYAAVSRSSGSSYSLKPSRILLINGIALSLARSEEHTSELQSRENLVCRLLLEKKKHNTYIYQI